MKSTIYTCLFFLVLIGTSLSTESKVNIIFDTDLGADSDDLGALAMLHHFHTRGECELLAIGSWQLEEFSVPAIDAMNRYFGNPEIPIGTRKGEFRTVDYYYGKLLTEHHPYELTHQDVPDVVRLYRQVLAESEDKSIVFVTVGPLANIKNLLQSPADDISELDGSALVHQKVSKFVIMGGKYPSGEKEWNFDGGMSGVTRYVVENLDLPIVFSGYELGVQVKTGMVFNQLPETHPLYLAQFHYVTEAPWMAPYSGGKLMDNSTYDQTAVLYAVRGGEGTWWKMVKGTCIPDEMGGNTWEDAPDGPHAYLDLMVPYEEMAAMIEEFMLGEF